MVSHQSFFKGQVKVFLALPIVFVLIVGIFLLQPFYYQEYPTLNQRSGKGTMDP